MLAEKGGLRHEQEAARAPRLHELPFSSERKRMTTVHLAGGERVAYVKGAAEVVLPRTTLSDEARAERGARPQAAMEHDALRVLAFARRVLPDGAASDADAIERDLEFLGLVGMIDPPRPEVPEAVRRCREAGIRIIMVTGDSGRTAEAIARRIGLVDGDVHVVTGPELARPATTASCAASCASATSSSPASTPSRSCGWRRSLREDGEIVAMTGDGVNDAPALKHADIGIAMGRGGTEVAKEAADLDPARRQLRLDRRGGRGGPRGLRQHAPLRRLPLLLERRRARPVPGLGHLRRRGAAPARRDAGARDRPRHRPAPGDGAGHRAPGARDDGAAAAPAVRAPARPPASRPDLRRIGPIEGLAAMASFFFAYVLAGWRPWEALADSGDALPARRRR